MRAGSLFSGIGQLDFGLYLAGIEHAWFCEADPWRRSILEKRWPGVPVFDDVRAVDGSASRVDLLVGGFPCRGASTAGKREGMGNPETALWREMARIVGELRPRLVLLENVAALLAVDGGRAWGEVVGDLDSLGYVGAWDCLPAAAFGAPHLRDRVFGIAALADAAGSAEGTVVEGRGERSGRPSAASRSAPDADLARQDPHPAPGGSRQAVGQRDLPSPNADGHPLRQQSEPERGGSREAESGTAAPGATDWGDYGPAIQRWEEVAGPAPPPLVRGLDARDARRVVRSRLSAHGDGVQMQAGLFLGERLLEYEGRRPEVSLVGFHARNHRQQVGKRGPRPDIDDRATTLENFAPLHERFNFTVDVAASAANTKLPRFYTVEADGLAQDWAGERVWCNPPYSSIEPWVEKAHGSGAEIVVMLLPANRTEQGWWQRHIEPYRRAGTIEVEFLKGRMRFLKPGQTEIKPNERPPFGCCLVIWRSPLDAQLSIEEAAA